MLFALTLFSLCLSVFGVTHQIVPFNPEIHNVLISIRPSDSYASGPFDGTPLCSSAHELTFGANVDECFGFFYQGPQAMMYVQVKSNGYLYYGVDEKCQGEELTMKVEKNVCTRKVFDMGKWGDFTIDATVDYY